MGAGADLAFKALDFGVSELSKGGITLKSPDKAGVRAENLSDGIRSRLKAIGPVRKSTSVTGATRACGITTAR